MKLFQKKEVHKNGKEYIVHSKIDPMTFKFKKDAKTFQILLQKSKRKLDSEIKVVTYIDGYIEEADA